MDLQASAGLSVSCKVEAEHRLTVVSLHHAPDVPMPYGQGTLTPTHAKLKYAWYGPDRPCAASTRILGYWKTAEGVQTKELDEIDFPENARYVPDWVRHLEETHCPVGWTLPPKAGPTSR